MSLTAGSIDKELVKRRFLKSLPYYDKLADIQRKIAGELSRRYFRYAGTGTHNIYEIGCGTGFLTHELLLRCSVDNYYINDLVVDALTLVEARIKDVVKSVKIHLLPGDAELLDVPGNIDSVVAASVVQWFDEFDRFPEKISDALPESGIFAFNTFGKNNLFQIKELTGQGLEYLSVDEMRAMLERYFSKVEIEEKIIEQRFDAPFDILRNLKLTGVTATGHFNWTKSKLEKFGEEYVLRYSNSGSVILTWHVIYAVCLK